MKSNAFRLLLTIMVALIAWLALSGASAKKSSSLAPDKLIILSTTDVKGKTSPCG